MSPDAPFNDQDPSDPQSWNLFSYVRNNPLKFTDPSGQDCVYTSNLSSDGTVGVERGSCSQSGGTFVDGTIDTNSLTYNQRASTLSYSYSNGERIGAGVIGGLPAPIEFPGIEGAANRAGAARIGASQSLINTFAAADAAYAAAVVAPYAGPALLRAAAAAGETGAAGPGVGLLKLAQKYGLNVNSPKTRQLLEHLDMSVEEFVGKFRQGSIKQAAGWTFDGLTVRQALEAGARKLLTDGRFDKTK